MVSTDRKRYSACVVRLGGPHPEPVAMTGEGTYVGRMRTISPGSYVAVPHSDVFDHLETLTMKAWIYPTMPDAGRLQGLVTKWSGQEEAGWGLYLDEAGCLMLALGNEGAADRHCSNRALRLQNWHYVTCSFDSKTGAVKLTQQALAPWPGPLHIYEGKSSLGLDRLPPNTAPIFIGQSFDGKIENPSLLAGEKPLASWDFSIGISTSLVTDTSPNGLDGLAVNTPMRAATGHSWRGGEQCFSRAPREYSAIHFHSDDLEDAGWKPDFRLEIPNGLGSGAYAVQLSDGAESDQVPFFVTPTRDSRAEIAFLAPTFTYLAYANEHFWSGTGTSPAAPASPDPADRFMAAHPEFGRGLYDRHADGSGCCYASRLRPLLNMRPAYRYFRSGLARHFSADLMFLQWLERKAFRYDVVTDEELHREGLAALSRYRVLITGSHPEYCTAAMLDALQNYLDAGGNLMYLGGNGFYWVTSVAPDRPHLIEVRRGLAGTRTWSSEPGELYHSTTGELGGLWRHRGRPPNLLVGVGFCAMGDGGSGYHRSVGSLREEVAFVFRGVDKDEVIGDFGAAGDEVDSLNTGLGSPPEAVLLASATSLNATYAAASEDQVIESRDEATGPVKRADMVYHRRGSGGAVFSVGSINWLVSISFNHDDNNVSRVTENVLRDFLQRA